MLVKMKGRQTMREYATVSELSRAFNRSRPTVYKRIEGIKKQIEKGRYNRYAIVGNLISVAVFLDFEKYKDMLADKNASKYTPIFSRAEAMEYIELRG